MAVAAPAADSVTVAARIARGDVRGGAPGRAGTRAFDSGPGLVTGWHRHDLHQLEYAFEGIAEVETAEARYLLPPRQAIWIPAGVDHNSTLTRVRTVSAFFAPEAGMAAGDRVRVLAVGPLLREMLLHARRWPIDRPAVDPAGEVFLAALAGVVEESLDHETPLRLPTSRHPVVAAAMRFTTEHLADVTLAEMCAAIGASPRSLRRAFAADTGMTWRRYLLESRLLRAMALLAGPDPTVLAVATAVGFESASGFTRAFRRYCGVSPHAYRRRVDTGEGTPMNFPAPPRRIR